jgi:cytochrome c-type biogenesis protein CcmH/NrfF
MRSAATARTLGALAVNLAFVLALAPAASATKPKTSLGDIEDEVMCPVCGVPLNLATDAPQAQRERRFIVELIQRGRSKSQIKQALASQFGDSVLATPRDRGFGRTAYLVPILIVLLGLAVATIAAVRWRRRRPPASGTTEAAPPPLRRDALKRLDDDLSRYDL